MNTEQSSFDVQGHRGCRGLLPENTIPAFLKALELGVSTIELDVVISKDSQVVVSHDPFFSSMISSLPDGGNISAENQKDYNIFQLDYKEIAKYDVGLKIHPGFPKQKKIKTHKPTLNEVFTEIEEQIEKKNLKPLKYNIEIKRRPDWDGLYHPKVNEFVNLVINEILHTDIPRERIIIQSFDVETLQLLKATNPEFTLALLIENRNSPQSNIQSLGFIPDIYSPYFSLVNKELVQYCKQNNIKLIPWTVNEKHIMKEMISLGVDGIISDYPDSLIEVARELKLKIL